MTDKETAELIKLLPDTLQRVANEIGLEPTLKLAKAFRGTYIYVSVTDEVHRQIRDSKIRSEYDKGDITVALIAVKYVLTERQIYNVLGKSPVEPEVLPLFEKLYNAPHP